MNTMLNLCVEEIKKEFPNFNIKNKRTSLFMRVLNVLVIICTFGQQRKFMTDYVSVVNNVVYVPVNWYNWTEYNKVSILRHERVHMRQVKKYGSFWFNFLYLFFPVPFLFAYYRAKFEKEAYEETIKFAKIIGGVELLNDKKFKNHIISQFTTGKYGWMWINKKDIEDWYERASK